jgi:hypothetical protein
LPWEVVATNSCPSFGIAIGIKKPDDDDPISSTIHVTIQEDNSGALILATAPPPQFNPRSKHYAIKTNWWRKKIIKKKINIVPIETRLQKGDIFTKMPSQVIFEYLLNLLQGW